MSVWVIIFASLFLSAFFSGMEIAYISSSKIHIEIEKKQSGLVSKVLAKLTEKPSKYIATMLIGNNIALVVYGFFMSDVLITWFHAILPTPYGFVNAMLTRFSLLSQTIISTLIILITAEFLPKVWFQIYSNTLVKALAIPAYVFYLLFTVISDFVIWISDAILKYVFKTKSDQIELAFTKMELGHYISEQMESIEAEDDIDTEIQIFKNALEFSEVKVRAVMVPRTEIAAVDVKTSIKTLSTLFTDTGFTKILVYKDTIDDVLGYVHSFDLFKHPKAILDMMLPVEFVPETVLIKDVLNILIKKRKSIAVVLDEYGGTSGVMTVEDIVEELFGEIEDEHDAVTLIENKESDTTYTFSARLEVDYLNEMYKLNLPESENYETLGGLIVNDTEKIPIRGETIKIEHFEFTILKVSNTKIDLVKLNLLNDKLRVHKNS